MTTNSTELYQGQSRSTAAAPVWARDHFQIVAVGVGKIDSASAVVMIDLASAATSRVGPVLETLLTDAAEDGSEISLGNQASVVQRRGPSAAQAGPTLGRLEPRPRAYLQKLP